MTSQFFCATQKISTDDLIVIALALNTNPALLISPDMSDVVGVLFFWQALGSVAWAMVLPRIKNEKFAYAVSLLIGAAGFAMLPFIDDQNILVIPFLLIGCAWAAMLAMPFAFVTNALEGYGHKGAYLGLFNGTICLPQIVAAAVGGTLLSLVGSHQYNMMIVAAVLLALGALSVGIINKKEQPIQ